MVDVAALFAVGSTLRRLQDFGGKEVAKSPWVGATSLLSSIDGASQKRG
jgi:hypothetical protein